MKKTTTFLITLMMVMSIFGTTIHASSDIKGHYAEKEINTLVQMDIMNGYPDGSFRPNASITRSEFISLLIRAVQNEDLAQIGEPTTFTDVKKDDWFYNEFKLAGEKGILKGYEDGKAKPNDKISRQEMAVLVMRIIDSLGLSSNAQTLTFKDKNKIADWAVKDIEKLVSFNIIKGNPDRTFAPLNNATRAETAVIVVRLLKVMGLIEKEEPKITYEKVTYPSDFADVVHKQTNNSPKVDGAGRFLASEEAVKYYVNPSNFTEDQPEFFQFLLLSYVEGLTADEIDNKILSNAGSLSGMGDAFINAAKKHNVNVVYLIAHALHETGKGLSALANGSLEVGLDSNGKPQLVTDANRDSLTNIKKTYNMFGIGAVDSNPLSGGAVRAYNEGWFTPEDAIMGGAAFITNGYISDGQDTLYKMKWNPANPAHHQYATHIQWATIQAKSIYNMYNSYNLIDTITLYFQIPEYKNQVGPTPKPSIENMYAVNPKLAGATGVITGNNVNFRKGPFEARIGQLDAGTKFTVIGENGGWYKINVNGQAGWVIGDYIKLDKMLKIININTTLNVRETPDGKIVGSLKNNELVPGVLDENGNLIKEGDWYQIYFNGKTAYIHGDFVQE